MMTNSIGHFTDDLSAFICAAGGYRPECKSIEEKLMQGDRTV